MKARKRKKGDPLHSQGACRHSCLVDKEKGWIWQAVKNVDDIDPRGQESAGSAFLPSGVWGRNQVPASLVMVYTLGLLFLNSLAKASLRVKRLGPCRLATAEWKKSDGFLWKR